MDQGLLTQQQAIYYCYYPIASFRLKSLPFGSEVPLRLFPGAELGPAFDYCWTACAGLLIAGLLVGNGPHAAFY